MRYAAALFALAILSFVGGVIVGYLLAGFERKNVAMSEVRRLRVALETARLRIQNAQVSDGYRYLAAICGYIDEQLRRGPHG